MFVSKLRIKRDFALASAREVRRRDERKRTDWKRAKKQHAIQEPDIRCDRPRVGHGSIRLAIYAISCHKPFGFARNCYTEWGGRVSDQIVFQEPIEEYPVYVSFQSADTRIGIIKRNNQKKFAYFPEKLVELKESDLEAILSKVRKLNAPRIAYRGLNDDE